MKIFEGTFRFAAIAVLTLTFVPARSQENASGKSDFWSRVHFGGGVGASFGSGYTDVMLAPGAIYDFNRYFSGGIGLQGSYVHVRDSYDAWLYGGSLLGFFMPIPELQLSAELEQLRVNSEYSLVDSPDIQDNFWNTSLFLGAGYRSNNVTVGIKYNVLHDDDRRVYPDAWMPFVRVYF